MICQSRKLQKKRVYPVATVSRVLNNPNYKCSSPEVRDRIWKAAIALNYTPNTAARNLKMGIQNTEKKGLLYRSAHDPDGESNNRSVF